MDKVYITFYSRQNFDSCNSHLPTTYYFANSFVLPPWIWVNLNHGGNWYWPWNSSELMNSKGICGSYKILSYLIDLEKENQNNQIILCSHSQLSYLCYSICSSVSKLDMNYFLSLVVQCLLQEIGKCYRVIRLLFSNRIYTICNSIVQLGTYLYVFFTIGLQLYFVELAYLI